MNVEVQPWKDGTGAVLGVPACAIAAPDDFGQLPTVSIEDFGGFWKLTGLYVPPVFRRRGLARSLVMNAVAWAWFDADRERKDIYLDALPYAGRPVPQSVLVRLYLTCGFHRVAATPYVMVRRAGL